MATAKKATTTRTATLLLVATSQEKMHKVKLKQLKVFLSNEPPIDFLYFGDQLKKNYDKRYLICKDIKLLFIVQKRVPSLCLLLLPPPFDPISPFLC